MPARLWMANETTQSREAALRFQARMLDSVEQAVIATDPAGMIAYWNRFAEKLYGWSAAEVLGRPILDVLPAIVSGDRGAEIMNRVRSGQSWSGEFPVRRRDGSTFLAFVTESPIYDDNGELIGLVEVSTDITERKQTERSLREALRAASESEERYRRLVDLSPDAIVVHREGRIVFANPACIRMAGASGPKELLGRPVMDFIHPNDHQIVIEQGRQTLQTSQPSMPIDLRLIRADGTSLDAEVVAAPILYQNHPAMQVIIRDVTERKRADGERQFLTEASHLLAHSLDYETTLSTITHLVVPYLADWCLVDVLEADGSLRQMASAHVDPSKAHIPGELRRLYPPAKTEPHVIWQVLSTGRPDFRMDIPDTDLAARAHDAEHLRLLREAGIQSHIVVPMVAHGRTIGAISFIMGDSGRRYQPSDLNVAEELARRAALAVENARLYRESQRAIRARDQFLSIASHELKTPLTSLFGYAQLLYQRPHSTLDERDRRALEVIHRQATHLSKLIETLLDISRIQIGQFQLVRKPIDGNALVCRVVEEMQLVLERHTLEYSGPNHSVWIEGDEPRLEQVLQNFIENAVKYSPGGGKIEITLTVDPQTVVDDSSRSPSSKQHLARIAIKDYGIGIPAPDLPQVFTRFYRAGNVDDQRISGMGMGLFVVQEIVTWHGGSVTVDSREGEGSTFTVQLPIINR